MRGIEPTWLTPAAHQKLLDELEILTTTGRIEVSERIAEARSHGDIRENADYDAAKNEQGLMEARIRKIEHTLLTSEVRQLTESDVVAATPATRGQHCRGDPASRRHRVGGLCSTSREQGRRLCAGIAGKSPRKWATGSKCWCRRLIRGSRRSLHSHCALYPTVLGLEGGILAIPDAQTLDTTG